MPKNKVLWSLLILGLILCGATGTSHAQETAPAKDAAQTESATEARQKEQKPLEAYHLDLAINELEDGKRINSRQYSLNLNSNDSSDNLEIGTKVPVEVKEGEVHYLDVGTSILARIGEHRGQTELTVRAEVSNFSTPEQGQDKHDPHPALRQLKISGSTLLPLGKPMVIGSVDDPNSKRTFQLEVTVTKLK